MANELFPEEITKIINAARTAKIHGFSGFFCKFSEHRIVDIRVELSEPRQNLMALYERKGLTVGTSGVSIPA